MPDNGGGEKQVDPAALAQSVIETPKAEGKNIPTVATSLLWFLAQAASAITAWGRNVKLRDRQLREFYPTENYFTAGLGTVSARNAAFNWELTGSGVLVRHYQDVLMNANQGEGWHDLIVKTSIDLYTQDNGAFWELVRMTDTPTAPVVGINHLDSGECWHTGDPLKPVVYRDTKGELHLLNWWNVKTFAEIPAPIEKLHGIQLCALTRLLRAAQILQNVTVYEEEKTGGRFMRAIHLIKGISTSEINDALAQIATQADNMGLVKYIQPMMVGNVDPKADVGHDTIELASMPDHFSKEEAVKLYITIIAMAFLSDYQDFAPLPGGNLGTSTQSEILHMKSRGKGPALFMGLMSNGVNFAVLPEGVGFKFAEQDLEADEVQADIRHTRADTRKIDLESGVLSIPAARRQALEKGDISKELFEQLEAEDEERSALDLEDRLQGGEKPDVHEEEVLREGEKQGVRQPARAGPFRGTADTEGEKADCCGSEGVCCYTEERNPEAPERSSRIP
ncbi:hypothetical protein LCGC14_1457400 [marine sediment metagenome]|uniref:Portal protein n=1 Tax=marine sediment metagenome TaxID=412755 RepID=A0A0F9LWS1_9ZZZZ